MDVLLDSLKYLLISFNNINEIISNNHFQAIIMTYFDSSILPKYEISYDPEDGSQIKYIVITTSLSKEISKYKLEELKFFITKYDKRKLFFNTIFDLRDK